MQQQRWRVRWVEDGQPKEFLFDSTNSRGIARIDFRLQAPLAGFHPPDQFELEEADQQESLVWLNQPKSERGERKAI
jgi:hypothetical protein